MTVYLHDHPCTVAKLYTHLLQSHYQLEIGANDDVEDCSGAEKPIHNLQVLRYDPSCLHLER